MRIYTVERKIILRIEEDVVAHSIAEALKIAEEVISFPERNATGEHIPDRVVEVGRTITAEDDAYNRLGGYLGGDWSRIK